MVAGGGGRLLRPTFSVLPSLNPKFKLANPQGVQVMDGHTASPSHLERTAGQFRAPGAAAAKVIEVSSLSPTVKKLVLKPDPGVSFAAGQWVDFFIPGVERVGGFSMSSAPSQLEEEGTLDLAVKASLAAPAHWVHTACKVGDTVGLRVGGNFFHPTPGLSFPHSILLVAGGVGINPLFSIMQQCKSLADQKAPGSPKAVTLLYSAKKREELIFLEEIKLREGWSLETFVTGEDGGRRLDQNDLKRALENMPGRVVTYLCGPPTMTEAVAAGLQELGMKRGDVKYENWW